MFQMGLPWWTCVALPSGARICFYRRDRGAFGFLSNFFPATIELDGRLWPHAEAYYQSQKSINPDYHDWILKYPNPSWAKFAGDSRLDDPRQSKKSWFRKHPEDLLPDWDARKLEVMEKALAAKFHQNLMLLRLLRRTAPADLIEDSAWDAFWGVGADGRGMNHLGKLLMKIRERLTHE